MKGANHLFHQWTLFLDRDGVINRQIMGDYVRRPEQFVWNDGSLEALLFFAKTFQTIVVVTNQQGVGKGLMSQLDLDDVHQFMLEKIQEHGGRIDKIYACTALHNSPDNCRKPNPSMALQAQRDFPNIVFSKSIMVGDSASDMEFAERLGMKKVFIKHNEKEYIKIKNTYNIDFIANSLSDWAKEIQY